MSKFLIAFDFDHTIVDSNSDIVAKDLLPKHALTDRLEAMRTVNGWTDYMQQVFHLLNEFGIDDKAITVSIVSIEPAPGILKLFDYLKSKDCEIIIISDSNTYFIDEWLKYWDLKDSVTTIYSNPACFKSGMLHIEKYHVQDWCTLSSVNLCKGHILEEHIECKRSENVEFDFVAYVGDGKNDVCPSLRLSSKDIVFARKGMKLEAVLSDGDVRFKARVVSWDDASVIADVLQQMCPK